jgi:hypothetical protein
MGEADSIGTPVADKEGSIASEERKIDFERVSV